VGVDDERFSPCEADVREAVVSDIPMCWCKCFELGLIRAGIAASQRKANEGVAVPVCSGATQSELGRRTSESISLSQAN
jgi:hypothetical protein